MLESCLLQPCFHVAGLGFRELEVSDKLYDLLFRV